jgi:Fic family protein
MMRDWLEEVEALPAPTDRHVMERLASVHAGFERVHPFLDGKGRTGRLLLVRLGYPPAVVQCRDRAKYLSALRGADAGNHGMLAEIIARAVADSLYRFVVPALVSRARS